MTFRDDCAEAVATAWPYYTKYLDSLTTNELADTIAHQAALRANGCHTAARHKNWCRESCLQRVEGRSFEIKH
jgi:hypothetical protein